MEGNQVESPAKRRTIGVAVVSAVVLIAAGLWVWNPFSWPLPWQGEAAWVLDRTVLPIHWPTYPKTTIKDVRDAERPTPFSVTAPEGAPNVVIFLLDDMGFGHSSAFGGGVPMPFAEKLADEGLRYNQFHTTALCSPTRISLLTGRNHHTNNLGAITETSTAFPGNTGVRPDSVAPLADILRMNGYNTAAFGKSHETAPWEVSDSGPFDRWPTGAGFEKFYGFVAGETNQWFPSLHDGTTKVEAPSYDGYNLNTDLADHAITWIRAQNSFTPDKPFFMYFAPGATHAPHHAPEEWIAKFKGKFDGGWDVYRQEVFERQLAMGIIPAGTKLAPKPEGIKDWNTLSADEQRLFSRQMEVFAGYLAYVDYEVGRVAQAIEDTGEADNTVIMYILGDNGASAEGEQYGVFNEVTYFNDVEEPLEYQLSRIDELGGPTSHNHYASGWAVAGDVPFEWTKQVASSYGGTRNGFIVRWPDGIVETGAIRGQWHHVVDIAQTVLEAANLPEPKEVNGVEQIPMQGVSMLYSFLDGDAPDRHTTQYFEIFGNRAIYHDGWLAGAVHRAPWEATAKRSLAEDVWELYDTRTDFSLTNDLASAMPEKLREMQDLFDKEAIKNRVYPIDDRTLERFSASLAGRPSIVGDRTSITYFDGMTMTDNAFMEAKNRDMTVTADIDTDGKANGTIIAQGGRFAGWTLYLKSGKPVYHYNYFGLDGYTIESSEAVPAGKATVKYEFMYDGGGLGKGGTGRIFINDREVASGRIEKTVPITFFEDTSVGKDGETAVDYKAYTPHDSDFTGTLGGVTVAVGPQKLSDADWEKYVLGRVRVALSGCSGNVSQAFAVFSEE